MELREEIVESEKARVDLLKWKIILIATLGAVALGFESTAPAGAAAASAPSFSHEYLLCLIPLVCLYVDLLCSHLNLRIMVIAHYEQYAAGKRGSDATLLEAEYELFAEDARNLTGAQIKLGKERRREKKRGNQHGRAFNVFSFEDLAQQFSSAIVSLFVFLWGIPPLPDRLLGFSMPASAVGRPAPHGGDGKFFMLAGASGVTLSALAYWRYRRRQLALQGLVEEKLEAQLRKSAETSTDLAAGIHTESAAGVCGAPAEKRGPTVT